jgi:hypothetical protein
MIRVFVVPYISLAHQSAYALHHLDATNTSAAGTPLENTLSV